MPPSHAATTICVDIGNSGMRCARYSGEDTLTHPFWLGEILRFDWPKENDSQALDAALTGRLAEWLEASSQEGSAANDRHGLVGQYRWVVSSVQRARESCLRGCLDRLEQHHYRLVSYRDVPWQIDVANPDQLGIDRLLAAFAAAAHYPDQPLIVIQAGSAITVDWIEPPNRYRGGAIMPGVPMMLRLLSRAADLLPEVAANELLELPPLPGKDTTAAMTAGVSSAVVGGVQHLIERYRGQYGRRTSVILSGGDGPKLTPHIQPPVAVVDHLVLRGLARLSATI